MGFTQIKKQGETRVNITDRRFKYTNSTHTDISKTLKRFGFKPTTDAERAERQRKQWSKPTEKQENAAAAGGGGNQSTPALVLISKGTK